MDLNSAISTMGPGRLNANPNQRSGGAFNPQFDLYGNGRTLGMSSGRGATDDPMNAMILKLLQGLRQTQFGGSGLSGSDNSPLGMLLQTLIGGGGGRGVGGGAGGGGGGGGGGGINGVILGHGH